MRISLCWFSLLCGLSVVYSHAQTNDESDKVTIEIGETVTIKSRFEGQPVVEPHISSHPSDNQHLLVAAMVVTDISRPYQSCRLSSFISRDGGNSWTETAHDYWGYDPWTAILPNGQTALSWLGTPDNFRHQFPIQFFTSGDGGSSWESDPQTFMSPHGHDGTKITAFGDEFYFTTVRFNDNMGADVILYHRENTGPFIEVTRIDSQGTRLNFCEPVILSDETALVLSSHFLQKVWVQKYDPKTRLLSDKYMVSINPGGARGYMRMVADTHESSLYKDRVYFVRALGSRDGFEGIWLNYSFNKGETWSKDARVDYFENQLPSRAMVASVAVNKDGVLCISWVDSQHDPMQLKKDIYCTISTDGGESFKRPVRVTKISSNPKTEKNSDVANKFPGGGHYLDIAAKTDGSFQLIWSDSRSGVFELQTCNVSIHLD